MEIHEIVHLLHVIWNHEPLVGTLAALRLMLSIYVRNYTMLPLSRVLFDAMWFQVCALENESWEVPGVNFQGCYYRYIRHEPDLLSTLVKYHVRQKSDSLFT